nr:hypothetical protein [Tanacetum cinerariifolium]
MEIVPDDGDEVLIEATSLSSKSPTIIDNKIHQEGKRNYSMIIRADGNSQVYQNFEKMSKNFNREDLEVLWAIVKDRFKKEKPVDDMDNLLFRTLKTLFEHHSTIYYLLVKKVYPLTKNILYQLWSDVRLHVDHDAEMAYDLLRFIKKQIMEDAEGNPTTTTQQVFETYKNVTQEIRDQLNAEAEAVQIILTGIDNDIYSTVDACLNACEMWKAIERLKQGESINVQDLETNLFWEFEKFTSLDGESL